MTPLLVAALTGTAAALYALHALLAPIRLSSRLLREFLGSRKLPELPAGFTDGALYEAKRERRPWKL